jgi:hypothetical protein
MEYVDNIFYEFGALRNGSPGSGGMGKTLLQLSHTSGKPTHTFSGVTTVACSRCWAALLKIGIQIVTNL